MLRGSGDSVEKMPEVISSYSLVFDRDKLEKDAYDACKKNSECASIISKSDSEILSSMIDETYSTISSTSMTNEQWEKARQEADAMIEHSKNPSSKEWFEIVKKHYSTTI